MKAKKIFLFMFILTIGLLISQRQAMAASYKMVRTNDSWPLETRTAGKAVFTATYDTSRGAASLSAVKGGKTIEITDSFNNGTVISNGRYVYYCSKESDRFTLYRFDLKNSARKKIGTLLSFSQSESYYHNISLEGCYGKYIYFIIDVPEGAFARINIKNGKVKKYDFDNTVSSIEQKNEYLLLTDGTGAGYSYLGLYNAANGKYKKITKSPYLWSINSKYVFYAKITNGYIFSTEPVTIQVKRYTLSSGKQKTLVKSLKVKRIEKITSKYIKYTDPNGKSKKKKW